MYRKWNWKNNSSPYHPQGNSAIEFAHKILQKFINDYFYTLIPEDFNIEVAILVSLEYHNNSINISTKFIQNELKDTINLVLIEKAKLNIYKNVGKKIIKSNELLLDNRDILLLDNNNIYVKDKVNEIL